MASKLSEMTGNRIMPPFNAEVALKSAEKRVDALERKFDEIDKLTRQVDLKEIAGVASAVGDLAKRVVTLETLVKALGQANTASKGAGGVMSAEAFKKAGLMTSDEINKLLNDAYAKQNAAMVKETLALSQKVTVQAQETAKTAILEARLKVL